VRAVALNAVHAEHGDVAEATNLATMRALLPHVPVLPFPHLDAAAWDDLAALARAGAPLAELLVGATGDGG
jgi:hypothetical protein